VVNRFRGWVTRVARGVSIACQAQRVLPKGGGESAGIVGEGDRAGQVQGGPNSSEQPAKAPQGRAGLTALRTGDGKPPRGMLLDYKPVI